MMNIVVEINKTQAKDLINFINVITIKENTEAHEVERVLRIGLFWPAYEVKKTIAPHKQCDEVKEKFNHIYEYFYIKKFPLKNFSNEKYYFTMKEEHEHFIYTSKYLQTLKSFFSSCEDKLTMYLHSDEYSFHTTYLNFANEMKVTVEL